MQGPHQTAADCIFHHPLEIRAAVRFAADGAVSIYFNDGHALAGGQFPALLHLLLNGAIALVGTGIPGIDDGTGCGISVDSLFHAVTLLSGFVDLTCISPNCNRPRKYAVSKITPHHMAGNLTLEQIASMEAKPSRQMSSNYAISSDGGIALLCHEADRSWCSSSPANDHRAITVEVPTTRLAGSGMSLMQRWRRW